MYRSRFIPARNSRHRIATLSLYRALLRSASKMDMPHDAHNAVPKDSAARAIRKAFVKNRAYTSHRLFLALLSKAQKPGSPEHNQVMAHLRSRNDLARPQPKPETPAQPRETFLKKEYDQDGRPVYKPNYVPHIFKTRIPSVCATADGQPFLRLKKPQPEGLSRMLGQRGKVFVKKIRKVISLDEGMGWDATQEDYWDELVAKQMRAEKVGCESERAVQNRGTQDAITSSYSWSVKLSRLWWEWKIERIWGDWNARGEALNQLVEEQRRGQMEREEGTTSEPREDSSNDGNASTHELEPPPNVGVFTSAHLPLMTSVSPVFAKQIARYKDQPGEPVDPFIEPVWKALVQAQTGRLLKWNNGTATGREREPIARK
ncbi:hypothetical protein ED733_006005 [Metarhizium rileyi]|uniref:Complex 1 LYR protein domain-containing protein n=1 Tax=Metarhizium rileyi (strain RCEF 4871) TaxID=1649241 RepID=A0A5C6GGE6_METRR|nr:hypothetical protein ED733_006005 [Metarhizium rileyi]